MPTQIAVLIATKDRESELGNRALRSVARQTRLPDYLVVVDDSHPRHREANRRIVDGFAPRAGGDVRVRYLQNDRTPGACGAWNVGLDWLHRQVAEPRQLFVAILDDDDRWEDDYLAACAACAEARGLDMVAADIMRHEEGAGPPAAARPAVLLQQSPEALRAADFLVTNPGIQGSNLFVRLDVLLAAGLFDEALSSTTDRDLCLRIADLGGVRYGRLGRPLVHHFADAARPRLSTAGSPGKLAGLDGFYRKYRHRMSAAERAAFTERARRLFGWSPPAEVPAAGPPPEIAEASPQAPLSLVVGMTTPSAVAPTLRALLEDLADLRGDGRLGLLEVILLENGPRGADGGRDLAALAEELRARGIGALTVPIERQEEDAAAGLFGARSCRGEGRVSIAAARTMLQTYLYLWTRRRPQAVVWILDDDMRLDSLKWRGGAAAERAPVDIVGTLLRLRECDAAVAIGTCTEAPPLPFASSVRTQLVDAWHNLELLAALAPDEPFPSLLPENMATRRRFSDYYYDLSRRETDHLETPFWYVPSEADRSARAVLAEIAGRLPRILAGEEVFRPLVHDDLLDPIAELRPSVHRGGNTFVFDHEALWDFPNGAPTVGGGDTRRSDMVWSLLNRYAAGRKVVKVPLPVRQDRSNVPLQRLDLERLARDIHGYAIYSALDDLLLGRREQRKLAGAAPSTDDLELGPEDVAFTLSRFRKYVAERLYAFQLSFHRAAGLARALGRYLDPEGGWWWLRDAACAAARERLREAVALLRREYDLGALAAFRDRVLSVDERIVAEWLDALRADIRARRTMEEPARRVAAWLEAARADQAAGWLGGRGDARGLRLLGSGAEGVVFTDGALAYKVLDAGRATPETLDSLRGLVGRFREARTLCCIEALRLVGAARMPVIVYQHAPGAPYQGGHGGDLRLLLQECREDGVVFTNVHPDNLIVTASGVRLIDYGVDVRPFNEEDWALMARRVWLSGRCAGRADLKELLRRSLTDPTLPELQGVDAFLRVDPRATKETLLDDRLLRLALRLRPRRAFDYGCGKGQLAAALAAAGVDVTAYDPDPALPARWRRIAGGPAPRFTAALDSVPGGVPGGVLDGARRYDVVLCCLVLCVLEEERAFRRALSDLARLAAPAGHVLIAVCNPDHVTRSTLLQRREPPADPASPGVTWKTLRASGVRRKDVHRPLPDLLRACGEAGLRLLGVEETPSIDPETLDPSSDFLILSFVNESQRRSA